MTYWLDAAAGLLGDEVLHEAGAGHDARPEPAGAVRVHVRTVAPVVVGRRELQADLVLEHMGRGIDLDVQARATTRHERPCCPDPRSVHS